MLQLHASLTPRQKFALLVLDFIVLSLALASSYYFRFGFVHSEVFRATAFWLIPSVLVVFYYIFGAYDLDGRVPPKDLALRTFFGTSLGFLIVIGMNYFLAKERMGLFGRGVLLPALALHFILSLIYRFWFWRWFHSRAEETEWLVLARRASMESLDAEAKKYHWRGHYFFLLPPNEHQVFQLASSQVRDSFRVLGSWDDLERMLNKSWSGLVVATPWRDLPPSLASSLMKARLSGQVVIEACEFFERNFRKIPVDFLGPEWFIFEKGFELLHNPRGLRIKRLADLMLAVLLLLFVWPLMLLTALAIKLETSGGALYRQTRSGQGGRNFTILKFRSMGSNAEVGGAQWAAAKDPRVTKVGKFIRLTRLDELPQLFNVLKGEMSFVGPRPERPEFNSELERQIPFFGLRHLVRPGITGWAQINYPYGASVEDAKEKLQYDLFYIKNHSLVLDLQVILKTIKVVLFGQGR